jgi:hypothetical protein
MNLSLYLLQVLFQGKGKGPMYLSDRRLGALQSQRRHRGEYKNNTSAKKWCPVLNTIPSYFTDQDIQVHPWLMKREDDYKLWSARRNQPIWLSYPIICWQEDQEYHKRLHLV